MAFDALSTAFPPRLPPMVVAKVVRGAEIAALSNVGASAVATIGPQVPSIALMIALCDLLVLLQSTLFGS